MDKSIFVHCNREEDVKFDLSDVFETKHTDGEISRYRTLCIGSDVSIFLNEGQSEKLCDVIEAAMYDEPTYQQLVEENSKLINIIEELQEKLSGFNSIDDLSKEHLSFQDVL